MSDSLFRNAMADPTDNGRKRFDLLAVMAAGFFLLAVGTHPKATLNVGYLYAF